MTDQPPGEHQAEPPALTYDDASGRDFIAIRQRYEELNDRDFNVRMAARLRAAGTFDPARPGHASVAACQPLTAAEHLELMAAGEVLARYYAHPSQVHHAALAGATWEQIAAARGIREEQARADYRAWATGQHSLASSGSSLGMPAGGPGGTLAALERADAGPWGDDAAWRRGREAGRREAIRGQLGALSADEMTAFIAALPIDAVEVPLAAFLADQATATEAAGR